MTSASSSLTNHDILDSTVMRNTSYSAAHKRPFTAALLKRSSVPKALSETLGPSTTVTLSLLLVAFRTSWTSFPF